MSNEIQGLPASPSSNQQLAIGNRQFPPPLDHYTAKVHLLFCSRVRTLTGMEDTDCCRRTVGSKFFLFPCYWLRRCMCCSRGTAANKSETPHFRTENGA